MKMRRPHRIPRSTDDQRLEESARYHTRGGTDPARHARTRSTAENTLNAALRRLGYAKDEMTAHGFRAPASSILNESGLRNPDAIEAQLAHVEGNAVRRAYARTEFWDERVKMMQWWADRLDEFKDRNHA